MPLKLFQRGDTYYVRGTVRGRYLKETCGTAHRQLAEAYRAKREAELYEGSIFGDRAVVSFRRAALSYLEFEPRSKRTREYVGFLIDHFRDARLATIDQAAADRAVERVVGNGAAPATKVRTVYTPLIAVLSHAAKRGWCQHPHFDKPAPPPGNTRWLTPAEARALLDAATKHLKPMLAFMLCTGARVSEAIDLQWADVDLAAGVGMLRHTKNGRDRAAHLPPNAIIALASIPLSDPETQTRSGPVFLRDDGEPYVDRERLEGGQIKTAFATACRRAGLIAWSAKPDRKVEDADGPVTAVEWSPTLTPHDLRHTFATWFYAITKDFMLLKDEGGWRTLSMVERYAHLMPSELVPQIATIWGPSHPRIGALPIGPILAQPLATPAQNA